MNASEIVTLIYPAGYTSADWTKASDGGITLVMPPQAAGSSNTKKYIGNYNDILRGTNEAPLKEGYVDETPDVWTINFSSSTAPVVGDSYSFRIEQLNPDTFKTRIYEPIITILASDTNWTTVAGRLYQELYISESTNDFTTTTSTTTVVVTAKAGKGLMKVTKMLSPDTTTVTNTTPGVLQHWSATQMNNLGIKNTPDATAPTENYYDKITFIIGVPQAAEAGASAKKLVEYHMYFSNPAKTSGGVVASTVNFFALIS